MMPVAVMEPCVDPKVEKTPEGDEKRILAKAEEVEVAVAEKYTQDATLVLPGWEVVGVGGGRVLGEAVGEIVGGAVGEIVGEKVGE
ncbi:hypothetical protein CYMTET_37810 [Cymbomonas tetramitiformis]|uniref:Uncharacterized protein n=1 Tax=Cymbomonas tetramitiformis TaxID=36881 RepID=A0AAE0CEP7_9CHLO|nr:hypothetical protein CYMTET_37810 [Cymbomonas tetramitiformis]